MAGSGHSFTNVVGTDDRLISLDRYTGLIETDSEAQTATVRAGTSLANLGRKLFNRNLAMENLGDIDKQSIAGAVSTGTHGTGKQFGVLSTQLSKIKMITPSEGRIVCSPDNNSDIFRAAQVSLGALGVLTELTLDLAPAYYLHEVTSKESLETCLSQIDRFLDENRHFEFFWFPQTEKVRLKKLNKVDEETDLPDWTYDEVIENHLFRFLCETGSKFPSLAPSLNRLSAWGAQGSDEVGPSFKIFSTIRDVRFNEMEYGVPAEDGSDVLRHLQDWIQSEHPDVQFPLEFRYVKGDDIPLSPAYGEDRIFIALHKYHKKSYESYLRGAEDIFKQYDGRPHWGKIHYRSDDELNDLYPEWDLFQEFRERFDPNGILLNDHLERIFGPQ